MLRWLRGGVASRAALRLLSSVFGSLSLFGLLSLSSLRFFFFSPSLQLRFSSLFIGAEPWGTIVSAVQRLVGQC